jgi:hypothetical protein
VVAIQFVAAASFQLLLGVPVVGAAILVAVLLGGDLVTLLQGSLYNVFTTILGTLMSEPVALAAFVTTFSFVLLGGSALMFLIKGGTVDVLVTAHRAAPALARQPLTREVFRGASQFSRERFSRGCDRLFRRYLVVGLGLMSVYALSGGAYLAFAVFAYRAATDRILMVGWTLAAALALVFLVVWITIVNLMYLLTQIAIAVDGTGVSDAFVDVARFIRAEFREVAAVFGVVVALVIAAVAASALLWSGLGLIAFVPLVGFVVIPLQLAAWLVRGLAFEYLGVTALGAYVTLYVDHASRRAGARPLPVRVLERSA